MTNVTLPKDKFVEIAFVTVISFILLIGQLLIAGNYWHISYPIILIPLVIILISYPILCTYILVFCIYITQKAISSPSILLIDIVALALISSFTLSFLARYRTSLKLPFIYKHYLVLLTAMVFTALFAHYTEYVYTPIFRIFFQLVLIVILFNVIKRDQIAYLVKFYFAVAIMHSTVNIAAFMISLGTIRIFGLAGTYYDDLTMLIFPIGLAYYLWSKSTRQSLFFGIGTVILLFGLVATHSRGPLLTVGWVSVALVLFSSFKAVKMNVVYVRNRVTLLFFGSFSIIALFIILLPIFSTVYERFAELTDPNQGTIRLRLSLWRASLMAFYNYPFAGIGPGNFRHVEAILPALKADPIMQYVSHLSAHNLFLHYLAENGIIGTVPLLALFYKYLKKSRQLVKDNIYSESTPLLVGLLFVAVTITFSIFYLDGWMWGQNAYALPFFIAITAKLVSGKRDEK